MQNTELFRQLLTFRVGLIGIEGKNPSWFKRHFGMDSQDIVYQTEQTLLEQNQTDWDEYESWIFDQDQVQVNLLNEEVA